MRKVYVKPEIKDRNIKVNSFILANSTSVSSQSKMRISTPAPASDGGGGIWGTSSSSDNNAGLW